MNYINNGAIDVSHLLLVEDSADSDADHGLMFKQCPSCEKIAADEIDDAESCSAYEGSEDTMIFSREEYEDKHKDENEMCDNQKWSIKRGDDTEDEDDEGDESRFGVNSNNKNILSREVVDKMEDRLFWEICIAVGYP